MWYTSSDEVFKSKRQLGYIFQELDSHKAWSSPSLSAAQDRGPQRGWHPETLPTLRKCSQQTSFIQTAAGKKVTAGVLSGSPILSPLRGEHFHPQGSMAGCQAASSHPGLLCYWDLGKAICLQSNFPSPGNSPAPSFLGMRTALVALPQSTTVLLHTISSASCSPKVRSCRALHC